MYKMIIIDDEFFIKEGIKQTINWSDYGINIIGEAENGEEGLELVKSLKPDIIITDIRMPIIDGVEFMKRIREEGINSHLIVVSAYDDFDYVKTALKCGASNYILKPIENQELINTVIEVVKKIENENKMNQYYQRLKSEITNYKKQLVRDIIIGNIDDDNKIRENIELFGLSLSEYLVISIRIQRYKDLIVSYSTEDIHELKSLIENYIINTILVPCGNGGFFIDKDHDEWVVILNVDSKNYDIDNIKQQCYYFVKRVINRFDKFNFNLSVGISNLHNSYNQINLAYKESFIVSHYKIFPNVSTIGLVTQQDIICMKKEVRDALEYIKANYQKDISIEEVANYLHISTSYLMHLFKDELNKTFNECLTEYRIFKSKELLKSGKYKIYEIAEMVGYQDSKYFSQVFKKYTGKTPKEYIDSLDEGEF